MTRPGAQGEDRAAEFLRARGYRILERNYRCAAGEIDIIAQDRDTLCFIEVKSRASLDYGHPAEAVTPAKQRHIARAAAHYLITHYSRAQPACRFDVIALLPNQPPDLIADAFRL